MNSTAHMTASVRVPAGAQGSREIKDSQKVAYFPRCGQGLGPLGKCGQAPRAGSGRELLVPLGSPGAAGRRGGWNLGTAASRRGAPGRLWLQPQGMGRKGIDSHLTLPQAPHPMGAAHWGRKAGREGWRAPERQKHADHPHVLQHPPWSYVGNVSSTDHPGQCHPGVCLPEPKTPGISCALHRRGGGRRASRRQSP